MKKIHLGLMLSIFVLSSLFSMVYAAKTPGTVNAQLTKVSPGVYAFTITNNGVRGIIHFQLNFVVPSGASVTLNTAVPNWSGGGTVGGLIYGAVGLTANAHKYYLKSSGDNSITIQFTISPAPESISAQWSGLNGAGTFGGSFPVT